MKKNRRDFLKISYMAGISIAAKTSMPKYIATQEKEKIHRYDKNLADKYGLKIPESDKNYASAPVWLQKADMFTADWSVKADMQNTPYSLWKGFCVELKDVLVERIIRLPPLYSKRKLNEKVAVTIDGNFDGRSVEGVSAILHVPHSKTGFKQAHEQGFRVIPYVHFSCIHSYYADQDVFLFQHPEILLKDKEGKWVHMSMDGTDRLYRLLVCANNPSYWKLALSYVRKLMDWGADGVFIDNLERKKECYAPGFTNLNPEFEPYIHEHLFPDASHDYAFTRFLQSVKSLVKEYGDDKVVIFNSGIGADFQNIGDCCTWESFIFSWAWEGRNRAQNWTAIKKRVKENEWYFNAGNRITALSYLNPSRKEVKEDAFWAFSSARLLKMIWWTSLKDTGAEKLYCVKLGDSLEPLQEIDQMAYRNFENGLIVLNDSLKNKIVKIAIPSKIKNRKYLDLFDGKNLIKINSGHLEVTVPAQTARVYILPEMYNCINFK